MSETNVNAVNSNNSTKIAEQYMMLQMMKSTLKSAMGEGHDNEFELMYQALTKSLENKNSSLWNVLGGNSSSSNKTTDVDYSRVLAGANLEDMEMVLKDSGTGLDSLGVLSTNAYNNSSYIMPTSSDSSMQNIYDLVNKYSKEYNVDPKLVLCVIQAESDFNPNVTSSSGAQGLMQIMPANFSHLGITNGYDLEQNIRGGVKLLSEYLNMFNGDVALGLMAYNAGPGTISSRGVSSISDLYRMPSETQNYVTKILNNYNG